MMNDTYGKLTIYDWNPTIATGNGSATIGGDDVLVGGETLEDILPNAGKPALLSEVQVISKDDTAPKLEIVIFDDIAASLGSFNGLVSITDAHAVSVLGVIVVETTDYTDWVASQRGQVKNVNLILRAKPGAAEPRDLRAGIIDRTGGAWTPSGLTVRFGIVHT
jgi:hypothetical protein